jgi:uncharacterized membrane protein
MKTALFFHLLGVILWAGGALNLSRLMAFHVAEDLAVQARLSLFEVKLFFFVTVPGLVLAAGAGLYMISLNPALLGQGWMQAKLGVVALFFVLTMVLGARVMRLRDEPKAGKKGPPMALHGVIGLCVVGILYLVMIARP